MLNVKILENFITFFVLNHHTKWTNQRKFMRTIRAQFVSLLITYRFRSQNATISFVSLVSKTAPSYLATENARYAEPSILLNKSLRQLSFGKKLRKLIHILSKKKRSTLKPKSCLKLKLATPRVKFKQNKITNTNGQCL